MNNATLEPETETEASNGTPPPKRPNALGLKTPPDWPLIGIVLAITLLGLLLRLWGIGWSLPDARHPLATYHPDELINLSAARLADIPHGQFDIGFYNYGAFYFYLVSLAQTIGRGYGLIPPMQQNVGAISLSAAGARETAALFLCGRLVTALMGTITIPVLFLLGNRLYCRRTGLLAALLYAIAPLAVVHAHFLTVDVPSTLFVTLALLWSARLLERQTWAEYAWAAVWTGLAAATKYNTGLVLIAPITAHFLNLPPGACRKHRNAQILVLILVTALTFLIACPGPVLNLNAFWDGIPGYPGSGVRYELFEHSRTGHGLLFTNTGPGWWYHLIVSLPCGLGIPLLLLSLAGIGVALARRRQGDLVLLAFLLLYYLATGFSAVRFARYMLPLFPVFCLLAARVAFEPIREKLYRVALQTAVILTFALTSFMTLALVSQMAGSDPRDRAADAMDKTLPPGASVAFATVPWFYSPPLSPLFGAPAAPKRMQAAEQTSRYQLRISSKEWDPSVLTPLPDVVVLSNIETMHPLDRLHLTDPTRFVQSIPPGYRRTVFAPGPIPGLIHGVIIPEDLLYILPTVTLYRKP